MAVPKRKTSKSKRNMRRSHQSINNLNIIEDKDYLSNILKNGQEKSSYIARKTLSKVYRKVGFVQR